MPRCADWAGLVLVTIWVLPAPAQTNLEWKLKEGDEFFVESVTTQKGNTRVDGEELKQDVVNTTVYFFKVLKKTAAGFDMEQRYALVRVKLTGGVIGDPLARLGNLMRSVAFKFSMTKQGKITHMQGYEAALKKITDNNPIVIKMTRLYLPKDAVQQAAQEVFGPLPDQAVPKGGTWKHSFTIPIHSVGSFAVEKSFAFSGTDTTGTKITFREKMKYQPPGKAEKHPFKILGGSLAATKAEGSFVFNPAAGRLVRLYKTVQFRGSLKIEAGNKKATLILNQEQTIQLRMLDKKPH